MYNMALKALSSLLFQSAISKHSYNEEDMPRDVRHSVVYQNFEPRLEGIDTTANVNIQYYEIAFQLVNMVIYCIFKPCIKQGSF